ncbi:ribosomal RNA-processing protein 7-domain-containing protein [Scenedesmus sp. NREL 46B-D3]|nr:ribosomal RNA-processing protein 7-domain-containing protein [Scenedesmus sp. NREL 46B-D3]
MTKEFNRYVFIKHHKPKEGEAEVPNALYVTGLPLGLDEVGLAAVFTVFGHVVNVVLHPSKRSAAVVYESSEGVSQALSHASSGQVVDFPLPVPEGPVGLKAWVAQHKARRPGNAELQKQLDDWMEAHEAAEAAREAAQQAAMAEDGWTVVVRSKGRKRARDVGGTSTVSGGIAPAAAAAARTAADAKQAKQADNFYRFQQRDKRRSELMDLRQKFEEGRKRLAALKAARHFKPS